ncbi:Na(+)/H(+) antiporter subunit C [Frankia sp. CNm7]|uniref:Na(+)/H(+) antiporter subunit C n=1 Tax=Frankia nepalensis TaxID=1836974 RepID=A0A937UKS5_9ACTN|nr:Na(+)/H(+) antiporter subunit C [Frankia nepalensis]MBL7495786.1 Na(+)/H(+) antiporter subunit C [Frankia nepalensis]MBL7516133.1 Na(+)/H(+) antiporter subunit C [Frankia nepalensis]MBL7524944.1 Na(+)/H(+) antiporter subunit C [Frankia nepalensis]MBL7627104.1 Na(+)/H(+) antiporter subunit C [Frankia nepalensis]
MTPTALNLTSAAVVGGLFTAGTYLLLQRSLMRILIGIVLLGHATNLLLLLVGGRSGRAPMVGTSAPEQMSNPLPQGMALTSIVITFALTTFLLALAYRSWTLLGDDEVRDDVEDARIVRLQRDLSAHRGTTTDPEQTDAEQTGTEQTDTEQDSAETDGSETAVGETDGAETDGAETDGARDEEEGQPTQAARRGAGPARGPDHPEGSTP